MPDRRATDRRTNPAIAEPLDRRRERREADRRHSARRPARFVVQTGATRREVSGEVALGGASFADLLPTLAKRATVELDVDGSLLRLDGVMQSPTHLEFSALSPSTTSRLETWLSRSDR